MIEAMYDMTARGRRVRCVYCKYPNHFQGIIVSYSSGNRYLVGRDCALTHHGVEFHTQLVDFDAAVDRQSYLRRRRNLLNAIPKIHEEFEELKRHPAIAVFGQVLHGWRYYLKEVAVPLANIAHRDELLSFDYEVRDEAAERLRKERLGNLFDAERQKAKDAGKRWQLFKSVNEVIGPIGGRLFFCNGTDARTRINEIQAAVQVRLRALSGDNLTTHQIKTAFKGLNEQTDALRHEFDRLAALAQAFDVENLSRIARWANARNTEQPGSVSRSSRRFIAEGRSITDRSREGVMGIIMPGSVSLSENYHVPKRTLLATLTEAIALEHEPH